MQQRLGALQAEHQRGTQLLQDLDRQRQGLVKSLLRISGAIQVLEEVLVTPAPAQTPAHGDARQEALCPNPNAGEPTKAP